MGIASTLKVTGTTGLSAVHRGLAFEKRSLDLLERSLSMSLRHVGGKSDGGVDLQGWWWVPTSDVTAGHNGGLFDRIMMPRKRIRVFAQCKAEKKKLGPHYVREMEGVLHRWQFRDRAGPSEVPSALAGDESGCQSLDASTERDSDIVGVLVSQSMFTKAAILLATSSAIPFMLLHIPALPTENTDASSNAPDPDSESPGRNLTSTVDASLQVGSMLLNNALTSASGPLRGEIEARWEWSVAQTPMIGRPGLWCHGRRIPSWVPESQPAYEA